MILPVPPPAASLHFPVREEQVGRALNTLAVVDVIDRGFSAPLGDWFRLSMTPADVDAHRDELIGAGIDPASLLVSVSGP